MLGCTLVQCADDMAEKEIRERIKLYCSADLVRTVKGQDCDKG